MVEARKRNPQLLIGALAWVWPAWVGQGTSSPWTNATKVAGYLVSWLKGARDVYNVTVDFIVSFLSPRLECCQFGCTHTSPQSYATRALPAHSFAPLFCPPRSSHARMLTGTSAVSRWAIAQIAHRMPA